MADKNVKANEEKNKDNEEPEKKSTFNNFFGKIAIPKAAGVPKIGKGYLKILL